MNHREINTYTSSMNIYIYTHTHESIDGIC